MSQSLIPRQVAFRIGLAARELDEVTTAQLMGTLLELTRGTLTLEALEHLGAKQLRESLRQLAPVSRSTAARVIYQLRQGKLPYGERDDDRLEAGLPLQTEHIRVAFSSNEGRWLDGSFARCARYLIYDVSRDDARLVEVRRPEKPICPGSSAEFDNIGRRTDLLSDCRLLYTMSLGTPATARLVRAQIHPVHLPRPVPCSHVVRRLQRVMKNAPPPWLKKALRKGAATPPT